MYLAQSTKNSFLIIKITEGSQIFDRNRFKTSQLKTTKFH